MSASTIPTVEVETITLTALTDPVVDKIGQHVTSRYCETFWLPVIGPSSLWLLRHAAHHTADGPYVVESETLGQCLGLGGRPGPNAPLARTLARLVNFRCAAPFAGGWALRTHLAPLTAYHLARLPVSLRVAHAELVAPRAVS